MKIPQDQSESFSNQSSSFKIPSNQSEKQLYSQCSSFQSEHLYRNKAFESGGLKGNSKKSCWFNFLVLAVILLIFGMELNYRSDELSSELGIETETKFQQEKSQYQQISIIRTQGKQPQQPQNHQQVQKENQQSKQKSNQQRKKKQEQRRKKQDEEAFQRECTKLSKDQKSKLFFLYLDEEEMSKQQTQKFHSINERYCHYHILYEVDFDYIIDVWNFREKSMTETGEFINKAMIKKQDKKMLFIFLQQYFWGGLYLHTSLGPKFGNYLSQRFISKVRVGKQVMFAEGDRQNQKGYLIPKRNTRAIKVEQNFSQRLDKMIRKIIAQQDWIDMCQNYQCMIMKNAIKSQ